MNIFISHAQADEALARKLADALRENGHEVWDNRQLLPGESWAGKTAEALQNSDAMVVLLTPEGLQSANVQLEIGYALGKSEYEGRLVPVVVERGEMVAARNIPWVLQRLQVVHLHELNPEGIAQIVQALRNAPQVLAALQ